MTTSDPFTSRPAAPSDMADVHALWVACQEVLTGERSIRLDDFRRWWGTPGFDLASSTQVVHDADGLLVGYAVLLDLGALPVAPYVNARVRPGHEGRGIGTALLTWGERAAHRVLDRLEPDLRVLLQVCGSATHAPTTQLFEDRGFTVVRHFFQMHADLTGALAPPVWPGGVRVVPFPERADLAEVLRVRHDAFLTHWGNVDALDLETELERTRHRLAAGNEDPGLWFLALAGNDVAGLCLCAPRCANQEGAAHVDILGVLEPWRRRGIGLALLRHAFLELRSRGHTRVCLDVDAASLTGAVRLYEQAGMSVLHRDTLWEKELRPGRDARCLGPS